MNFVRLRFRLGCTLRQLGKIHHHDDGDNSNQDGVEEQGNDLATGAPNGWTRKASLMIRFSPSLILDGQVPFTQISTARSLTGEPARLSMRP